MLLAFSIPIGAAGLAASTSPLDSCFFIDGAQGLPEGTSSSGGLQIVPPAHVCSFTLPDGSATRIEAQLPAAPWLMLAAGAIAVGSIMLRRRWPAAAQAALNGLFAVTLAGAAGLFATTLPPLLLAVPAAAALWVRVVARAMPVRPSEFLMLAQLACTALVVLVAVVAGAAAGWAAAAGIGAALLVSRLRRPRRPLVSLS